LKIKRLKLAGFKSFVDPAELRIETGLTGIVGPNGCGKSNLLEAIRWVMGESSAKSMRGAGMEDVIFAGTATRPARDFAEVTILTERGAGEGAGPIASAGDGDVEVIRRIERGAGSAYRVNGRDVRAKDVSLIFADAATGAHSPALVSQGRIGAIIAAKPAERRAMLEEAAGIAGLHVRRRDAEQKLRAAEANLSRVDDLLADMETRAAALKRQARQAEKYRQLSDQIKLAEGRLIFARWRDAAAAADAARAEAQSAEALVAVTAEAQRAAAVQQHEAAQTLGTVRAEALRAREAANDAGHRLASLRTERTALDRRIAELASAAERLESDRARESDLARDAAEALQRLGEEGKMLDGRIAAAEKDRPGLAERLARAEVATRDAEVELAQALAGQAGEQAERRVTEAAIAAAAARLARTTRDREALDRDRIALGEEAPLIAQRDLARDARRTAERQAETALVAIEQTETARREAVAARDAAEAEGSAARAMLAALDSEVRALTRALDRGDAKVVRAIDRVRAAPGYERALAAALGDDLDAAIGAQGKRRWAGADALDGDPALASGGKRLSDHVDAPVELARRLAQVVVVEADEGLSLAVGQRLVTRDGRLRRWDGYVAEDVGAAAAERLVRINRLAELEAALPEARSAVERAGAAQAAAVARAEAAKRGIDQARATLAQAEAAARSAIRGEDQVAAAIERLETRRAEIDRRVLRAEADTAEARAEHEAASAALAALPDGSVTARLVAALQSANEVARATSAQLRAEAATLDRAIAADRERRDRAAGEAKGWRARAGEAARRIEEMAQREKAVETERAALADAPALLDARIAALETDAAQLTAAAATSAAAERDADAAVRAADVRQAQAAEALSTAREARAGAVARAENQEARRIEMGRISGERFECPAPVLPEKLGFVSAEVGDAGTESGRLERLTAERERIGPVNLVAEQELREVEEEHDRTAAERDELGQAINRLRGSIGSLNREGRARLLAAFEAVDGHFRRLFTTLFAGGEAHLALIDSEDPLEAGLEIMAQPPGKKLAALTLLSGGEQALTAVALIFGLFLTNPAPICVLDEVDAPLDDANIERFCDLLDAMTRETDTRYLIVTHNAVTMARMHRLFGVTMIEQGVSRLVSVDLGGAERLLAAE